MKDKQVLEIMEEMLLEYSICYNMSKLAFLCSSSEPLHPIWIKMRTINNFQFDALERIYTQLAKLNGVEVKDFSVMSISPLDPLIADKIFQMTISPSKTLVWPAEHECNVKLMDLIVLNKKIDEVLIVGAEKKLT